DGLVVPQPADRLDRRRQPPQPLFATAELLAGRRPSTTLRGVAAARSLEAVHPAVAAVACGEPAAVHRSDRGLGAHRERSGGLQSVVAELAQGVEAALEQLARERETGTVARGPVDFRPRRRRRTGSVPARAPRAATRLAACGRRRPVR